MATLLARWTKNIASTAYGFAITRIPAGVITAGSRILWMRVRSKWSANGTSSTHGYAMYFYQSDWSSSIAVINNSSSNYVTQNKLINATILSSKTYNITCYANGLKNAGVADGAILTVDWYELWDVTGESVSTMDLKSALGLNGPGTNLLSGVGAGKYTANWGNNYGVTSVFQTTYTPVIKGTFTNINESGPYIGTGMTDTSSYYNLSFQMMSDVATGLMNIFESGTDYNHNIPVSITPNVWHNYWIVGKFGNGVLRFYTKNASASSGNIYIRNVKLTKCTTSDTYFMAYTPSEADDPNFSQKPLIYDFKGLQSAARDANYFNTSNPINQLTSWQGYNYYIGTYTSTTYSDWTLNSITPNVTSKEFTAAGGSMSVTCKGNQSRVKTVTTNQLYSNGNAYQSSTNTTETRQIDVTPTLSSNATSWLTVSGTTVSAASRGTTIGSATSGVITVSYGGKTTSINCSQVANKVTSLKAIPNGVNTTHFEYRTQIPAAGGSVSPTLQGTAILTFSSGSTYTVGDSGSVLGGTLSFSRSYSMPTTTGWTLNTSTGALTATNNTSTSTRTSGTVTGVLNTSYVNPSSVGGNTVTGTSSSTTATATQAAGYYSYSAWSVAASASPTTIGAGGGTSTISGSASRTYGWNGSTSGAGTQSGTVAYSIPTTSGASLSSNKLTWANRTTTVGSDRSVVVTVTCQEDKSKTSAVTITQSANSLTWNNPAITYTYSDVSAAGSTVTPSVSITQSGSYSSGSTASNTTISSKSFSGTGVNTSTGAYTGSSLGTTVKARTKLSTGTVSVTANSKTATKSADIYQAENKVTNSNYNPRITAYGTPTISIGSGITAAGGSATVTASVSNTQTYNALYSSGSTGSNQTRSVAGSVTLSLVSNGNSRFSLSGTTLSHSSMTTNLTTDTATVRATNANSTTLTKDASVSVTNSREVTGTTGGAYTYYDVSAGAISNKTIPASGGNATATAGNGSQRVTSTAITTSYKYTSGSMSSAVTTAASDNTNSISPSVASKYGSASSKGTTVSGITTVASQAVIWSGQGNKSASGTMYVYQAANSITYGSYTDTFNLSRTNVGSDSDYVVYSGSSTRPTTYTSGSTGTETSAIKSVTSNQSWATISGDRINVSSNGSPDARSATLTCTYNNNRTKTATLTQSGVSGNLYVQVHNNLTYDINWQVGFKITLNGNYITANGYSSYYLTMYGSDSISTEPVGIILPSNAGITTCDTIKLTELTVQCTNGSGSYVGRNFIAWVEVEKSQVSTGANKTLSTAGSQSSPMINYGTTNSSPRNSSDVQCSPTFYVSEAGRYIIHILIN